DLGVAHLPVGKPDAHAGRAQLRGGILRLVFFYVGAAFEGDGVALPLLADAVAVHNDDRIRFFHKDTSLKIFFRTLLYTILRASARERAGSDKKIPAGRGGLFPAGGLPHAGRNGTTAYFCGARRRLRGVRMRKPGYGTSFRPAAAGKHSQKFHF